MANSIHPGQTAPFGAVYSGYILFVQAYVPVPRKKLW